MQAELVCLENNCVRFGIKNRSIAVYNYRLWQFLRFFAAQTIIPLNFILWLK
jgi:hypothetical protein